MKESRREKAESITQKLISEYIITELPELIIDFWIVTITQVKISSELSYIDVFVSCMKNTELLTKKLALYAHPLHRILWREIDFIKVPKIRFRYDESGKNMFEIAQLIDSVEKK